MGGDSGLRAEATPAGSVSARCAGEPPPSGTPCVINLLTIAGSDAFAQGVNPAGLPAQLQAWIGFEHRLKVSPFHLVHFIERVEVDGYDFGWVFGD